MREEWFTSYDSSRFNGLPAIELADEQMRADDRLTLALKALSPVFIKHEMYNAWGISLLHNHWTVENGEIPLQDITETSDAREFETAPRTATFEKPFWPSLFAVSKAENSELRPLEFTTDLSACEANRRLVSQPEFCQEFAKALSDCGLNDTFGLVMLRNVSSPEFQLVEFNYEGRISVLRETMPSEVEGKNLIKTAWQLNPPNGPNMACVGSCFSQCIVPAGGGGHNHAHPKAHNPHG